MASKTLICFDASINNGKVGIGIWDASHQTKVFKSFPVPNAHKFGSNEAERMALIATLQYMKENDIKQAHIFTDNMNVYNEGISKSLLRKYTDAMDSAELFWIPRQFNKEADALSKKGSEVSKVPVQVLQEKKQSHGNSSIETSLKQSLKSYSKEKRFDLMKRLAITDYQMNFIYAIMNNDSTPLQANNADDIKFTQFICSIFNSGEVKSIDNFAKQFKKRPKATNAILLKVLRRRELI